MMVSVGYFYEVSIWTCLYGVFQLKHLGALSSFSGQSLGIKKTITLKIKIVGQVVVFVPRFSGQYLAPRSL